MILFILALVLVTGTRIKVAHGWKVRLEVKIEIKHLTKRENSCIGTFQFIIKV